MKILDRINALARLEKTRDLTAEEKEEQARLRKEYLDDFRKNLRATLLKTKVVDEKGQDVTPEKLKKEKEKEREE